MRAIQFLFAIAIVAALIACAGVTTLPDHAPPKVSAADQEKAALKIAMSDLGVTDWVVVGRVPAFGGSIYGMRLTGNAAADETPYLTLDEAMSQSLVEVREMSASGSVNTLQVINKSGKPVFLMAGDLMLGGKQDRILAESLVVDAGDTPVSVPVFCVEQGRWSTQSKDGALAQSYSFSNVAEHGQAANSIKLAALGSANQSEVWSAVAGVNATFGVSGETTSGTFRASVTNEDVKAAVESAFSSVDALITGPVHGYAMIVNGEVVAIDMFDSAELASKIKAKLVRGYVTTAMAMQRQAAVSKQQEVEIARNVRPNQRLDGGTATLTLQNGQATTNTIYIDDFEVNVSADTPVQTDGTADSASSGPRTASRTLSNTATITTLNNRGPNSSLGFRTAVGNVAQTRTISTSLGVGPPTERASQPTVTTRNSVTTDSVGVRLTSEDSKRGKVIHRSFIRK